MKNLYFKTAFILSLFLVVSNVKMHAQFEQKFTFQAAAGYVQSIKPDFFSLFFPNGYSIDAGAQYNFNRSTSLVVLAKYSTFFSNDNYMHGDMSHNLFGLSVCPKLRLIPYSKFNPYFFGGGSINYYKLTSGDAFETPWMSQFGFTGGIGTDITLTDNIALFIQGGIYGVNHPEEMLLGWYFQTGINISMFKARTF